MSWIRLIAPLALSLAGLAGCGPGYKIVPVSGKVTMDDKPLADAKVTFAADASNTAQTPGTGQSGPDGTYQVRAQDHFGLAPGKYKVIVELPRSLTMPGWDKLSDIVKEDPLLPMPERKRLRSGSSKQEIPVESEFDVEVTDDKKDYSFDVKGGASPSAAKK